MLNPGMYASLIVRTEEGEIVKNTCDILYSSDIFTRSGIKNTCDILCTVIYLQDEARCVAEQKSLVGLLLLIALLIYIKSSLKG